MAIGTGTSGTNNTAKNINGCLIVFGRGDTLGDFSVFAEWLRKDLSKQYGKNIVVRNIEKKEAFFNFLEKEVFPFAIAELHIFSHAFGAGLCLGYGSPVEENARNSAIKQYGWSQNRHVSFSKLLETEAGIIFTDDLLDKKYISKQATIRQKLKTTRLVKIWGCNSGVPDWVYEDSDPRLYYWRTLNEQNTPKPSIAGALAKWLKVTVWGAKSGSHVEVQNNGVWMTSEEYHKKFKRWPSGSIPNRLNPDKGDYVQFSHL